MTRSMITNESRSSIRRLQSHERKLWALRMRKEGMSLEEIGSTLGITTSSVSTLIKRALFDTLKEPADQVRDLELTRLDELWLSSYPTATRPASHIQDLLRAIEKKLLPLVCWDKEGVEVIKGIVAVLRHYPSSLQLQAVSKCLDIMARRSSLLGIDKGTSPISLPPPQVNLFLARGDINMPIGNPTSPIHIEPEEA